jgi:hypothetical protein
MGPAVRHLVCVVAVMCSAAGEASAQAVASSASRLNVFLDCDECFGDYIREEVDFVEYVRETREADVHIIVTRSDTASGGIERAVSLVGVGRFQGTDYSVRAVTQSGDSEDTERRRLASAIAIGLLTFLSRDGVSSDLTVQAAQGTGPRSAAQTVDDPWNNWVFSLNGSVALDGEESSRQANYSGAIGVDRITEIWKLTFGFMVDYEREDFDLDEDAPLRAIREEREFDGLIARGLTDHWSVGADLEIDSSTFDNISIAWFAAPAVEYNVFPYSAYTRRQLRINYAIGPYRALYVEPTLYGKLEDTFTRQVAGITLEQREPWGTLEASFEASNYLPGLDRHRLELEGDVTLRLARGLSLAIEGSAARLRDQIAIPRRDATEEEVLLELRQLQTGYQYSLEIGLTYTFGSIFNTIVNPRFGN